MAYKVIALSKLPKNEPGKACQLPQGFKLKGIQPVFVVNADSEKNPSGKPEIYTATKAIKPGERETNYLFLSPDVRLVKSTDGNSYCAIPFGDKLNADSFLVVEIDTTKTDAIKLAKEIGKVSGVKNVGLRGQGGNLKPFGKA
jgi:hypothetical protein